MMTVDAYDYIITTMTHENKEECQISSRSVRWSDQWKHESKERCFWKPRQKCVSWLFLQQEKEWKNIFAYVICRNDEMKREKKLSNGWNLSH